MLKRELLRGFIQFGAGCSSGLGMATRAHTRYRDQIGVCEEWSTYPPFKVWSELNGYVDGLTIDRINNDDSYSPEKPLDYKRTGSQTGAFVMHPDR